MEPQPSRVHQQDQTIEHGARGLTSALVAVHNLERAADGAARALHTAGQTGNLVAALDADFGPGVALEHAFGRVGERAEAHRHPPAQPPPPASPATRASASAAAATVIVPRGAAAAPSALVKEARELQNRLQKQSTGAGAEDDDNG